MNYKILINKDNLYDKRDFSNIELKKITNILNEEYLLEKRTLKAFLALKKDLSKDNIFIDIISGLRTIEEQEQLIDEYTNKYGKDYIKHYVAPKGSSEHHTGLCLDIGLIINNNLVCDNDILLENS